MALKTLKPAVKQAIEATGVKLTATTEHLAALATIDWAKLIADLGKMAPIVIQAILAILGILNPAPNPSGMKAAAAGGCDHYVCCCEVLKAALHTTKLAAEHCCCCCEGGYG